MFVPMAGMPCGRSDWSDVIWAPARPRAIQKSSGPLVRPIVPGCLLRFGRVMRPGLNRFSLARRMISGEHLAGDQVQRRLGNTPLPRSVQALGVRLPASATVSPSPSASKASQAAWLKETRSRTHRCPRHGREPWEQRMAFPSVQSSRQVGRSACPIPGFR